MVVGGVLSQSFLREAMVRQFWYGQECPLFDVVHSAFPLLTTALLILQGALREDFGEVVVVCDMPKPCKFLINMLISNSKSKTRQKKNNKETSLIMYPKLKKPV